DRSAVIFGGAYEITEDTAGLRARLARTAHAAGMALCGAGCMGFVNLAHGLRARGYIEPDPPPPGPRPPSPPPRPGVSPPLPSAGWGCPARLRGRGGPAYARAVPPGEGLAPRAAAYARSALSLPQTRVLGLVLGAIRAPTLLRQVLGAAAAVDIPVVLLTAG